MYQCYNCDATFEKPIKIINYHGLDEPPYEILMGCPACNSDDIEEVDGDGDIEVTEWTKEQYDYLKDRVDKG